MVELRHDRLGVGVRLPGVLAWLGDFGLWHVLLKGLLCGATRRLASFATPKTAVGTRVVNVL
jgi:hypothetical protein